MDDLISRQAALRTDCFGDGHDGLRAFHAYEDYKKMRDYIESLPSVQPEIIHCKGCLHKIKNGNHYECNHWDFEDPKDDGFCNFAERRTDG